MRILTALLVLVLVVGACGGGDDAVDERPGSPQVYADIAAETDCAELQATFDRAAANHDRAVANDEPAGPGTEREWTVAYMTAAEERRVELGCS